MNGAGRIRGGASNVDSHHDGAPSVSHGGLAAARRTRSCRRPRAAPGNARVNGRAARPVPREGHLVADAGLGQEIDLVLPNGVGPMGAFGRRVEDPLRVADVVDVAVDVEVAVVDSEPRERLQVVAHGDPGGFEGEASVGARGEIRFGHRQLQRTPRPGVEDEPARGALADLAPAGENLGVANHQQAADRPHPGAQLERLAPGRPVAHHQLLSGENPDPAFRDHRVEAVAEMAAMNPGDVLQDLEQADQAEALLRVHHQRVHVVTLCPDDGRHRRAPLPKTHAGPLPIMSPTVELARMSRGGRSLRQRRDADDDRVERQQAEPEQDSGDAAAQRRTAPAAGASARRTARPEASPRRRRRAAPIPCRPARAGGARSSARMPETAKTAKPPNSSR